MRVHPRFIFFKPRVWVVSPSTAAGYGCGGGAPRARCGRFRALLQLQLRRFFPTRRTLGRRGFARLLLLGLLPLRFSRYRLCGGIFRNQLAAGAGIRRFALAALPLCGGRWLFLMRDLARDRYLFPDQLFDIRKIRPLAPVTERNRRPLLSGAARAANAVDIRFRNIGQLEIDRQAAAR